MHEPTELFLIESSPSFKMTESLESVSEQIVRPSHVDCLGHVNNCRYGEFAYDAFTDEEQKDLVP